MSVTDELLANNKVYVDAFDKGDLPLPPGRRSPCWRAWTPASTSTARSG
jgi:hypothetical protein